MLNIKMETANLVAFANKNVQDVARIFGGDLEEFDYTILELLAIASREEAIANAMGSSDYHWLNNELSNKLKDAMSELQDEASAIVKELVESFKEIGFDPYRTREYHDGRIEESDIQNSYTYLAL